ncbi:MAG: hypothetical protein ACLFRK_03290 [Candidatus Nanohaloarchaea archaeon]
MRFSELQDLRIKLDETGRKEFWHRVEEFGGVKTFAEAFEFSPGKAYNWKSKDSFIPIELVKKVFGNEASQHVKAYKGPKNSSPIRNPVFPIPENDELLTRIEYSVTVNRKGIPVYQTNDEGLVRRFQKLLNEVGDVPVKIYRRDIYELRYPKHLHQLLDSMSFEEDLDARIDEEAEIEGKILLNGEEVRPEKVGKLFHREKRMKLALLKQDNEEVANLMAEERKRVREALNT